MTSFPPFVTATAVPIPPGFPYDLEGISFTLQGYVPQTGCQATTSKTPEQLFDTYSTARSAPGATFYVATNGSDSNNGLTSGTPFLTMSKAITAANTAAVPSKIYVAAGTYPRSSAPNFGTVYPAVDIAWIASGNVIVGSFDQYTAPSADATYTNTYSWALASVDRVIDLLNLDQYGRYQNLLNVSSAPICNRTPNSWYTNGTTLYINRGDGAAVTNANTRVYRATVNVFMMNANVNQYFGDDGLTYSGFNFEGGQYGGLATTSIVSGGVGRKILVAKGSSFCYAGGVLSTAGRGVALDSFNGAAWFFNCAADRNFTDGFNAHNTYSATNCVMVTVNCSAHGNGENPAQSNNGWTSHENVTGVDIAGYYRGNHGGTCRSINSSTSLFAGTLVTDDFGDVAFGGAIPPTAFRVDNTATYYCFQTAVNMAAGTIAYNATSGATIKLRQAWPTRGINVATGTIGTW